jgi:hypothetical protein
MVELCPRRAYGGAGIPQSDPTRRTVGRGCARHHRRSPDRVGSGEVGGAGIGSRCVGSHQLEIIDDYRNQSSSQNENLSAKRRLALPSWHGWATNKQEEFEALDHHGCLACSGRVGLLSEIAMKLI